MIKKINSFYLLVKFKHGRPPSFISSHLSHEPSNYFAFGYVLCTITCIPTGSESRIYFYAMMLSMSACEMSDFLSVLYTVTHTLPVIDIKQ